MSLICPTKGVSMSVACLHRSVDHLLAQLLLLFGEITACRIRLVVVHGWSDGTRGDGILRETTQLDNSRPSADDLLPPRARSDDVCTRLRHAESMCACVWASVCVCVCVCHCQCRTLHSQHNDTARGFATVPAVL
jgi:hypothetical protein